MSSIALELGWLAGWLVGAQSHRPGWRRAFGWCLAEGTGGVLAALLPAMLQAGGAPCGQHLGAQLSYQPANRYYHSTALPLCRCDVDIRKDLYSNIVLSGELPCGALQHTAVKHVLGAEGAALVARVDCPTPPPCMAHNDYLPGCCS